MILESRPLIVGEASPWPTPTSTVATSVAAVPPADPEPGEPEISRTNPTTISRASPYFGTSRRTSPPAPPP